MIVFVNFRKIGQDLAKTYEKLEKLTLREYAFTFAAVKTLFAFSAQFYSTVWLPYFCSWRSFSRSHLCSSWFGCKIVCSDVNFSWSKVVGAIFNSLFLVCKKRTLFDDRPVEIQELTYIIKQDITSLKRQIQQLEDNRSNLQANSKRDVQKHTTSVVKTLRVTAVKCFRFSLHSGSDVFACASTSRKKNSSQHEVVVGIWKLLI